MVSVKSCCCGCSLSRGTLILGIVGIVLAVISLFMGFADGMYAWTLFIAGLVGLVANALLICGVK
jgi:hypothetical protein